MRLNNRGFDLSGIQMDEFLSRFNRFAFIDQNVGNDARHLASDLNPEWRFKMPARNNRFDQIAALDLINNHLGPEEEPQ